MPDLDQRSAKVCFQAVNLSYNTATSAELVHICASGICAELDPGSVHRYFPKLTIVTISIQGTWYPVTASLCLSMVVLIPSSAGKAA